MRKDLSKTSAIGKGKRDCLGITSPGRFTEMGIFLEQSPLQRIGEAPMRNGVVGGGVCEGGLGGVKGCCVGVGGGVLGGCVLRESGRCVAWGPRV